MIARKIKVQVYGRVQGVYFRHHTKLMADSFGLSGWVRNRSNGSVEAFFSGNGSDVTKIIEWLNHGPEAAVVEKIDVEEIDHIDFQHSDFIIKY